jgi:hypothetical protein
MSGRDALRSAKFRAFSDIPRDAVMTVQVLPDPKMYVPWDAQGMALTILGRSVETLNDWLTARLADLNREKVPMEDVQVVSQGGRTQIKVLGKTRFEFKLKITMEGK